MTSQPTPFKTKGVKSHPGKSKTELTQKAQTDRDFTKAVRSFSGFLNGVGKSPSTVEAYLRDLKTFRKFYSAPLSKLGVEDLDAYPEYLKKEGFRLNTRRRQMLTVRSFLKYLRTRKKLKTDLAARVPSMERSERFPHTFDVQDLRVRISELPQQSEIEIRNRAVLWVLLETGCQVSELPRLTLADFHSRGGARVKMGDWEGGVSREIPVSMEMIQAVRELGEMQSWRRAQSQREEVRKSTLLFEGFNKFGPMGNITPRGIELLVKSHALRFRLPQMKPRNLRHSIVLKWMEEDVALPEVQYRLGLKSDYALRMYRAIANAKGAKKQSSSSNP